MTSQWVSWSTVPAGPDTGPVTIYALVDPRDETVRYVGATSEVLADRLARHIQKPTNGLVRDWLVALRALGLAPSIRPLSAPRFKWEASERAWIAWFRERGALLNIDPGGICRDSSGNLRKGWRGKPQEPLKKPRPMKLGRDQARRAAEKAEVVRRSGPVRVLGSAEIAALNIKREGK